MSAQHVLVGDVGGTKTVLTLYETSGTQWRELASTRFASGEHPGLEEPVAAFLRTHHGQPNVAVVGVAGPVEKGVCRATNLPWIIDAAAISRQLKIGAVRLINDFEATARGLFELRGDQLWTLQEGLVDPSGPVAVLGAGTGLGQALVMRTKNDVRVLPTEGGHCDFAPRDEIEDGLLRYLRRSTPDHVSYERVLSGPGLAALHGYVVESGLATSSPDVMERLEVEDPGAVVGELGVKGTDPACVRAVHMFVSLYGAEAGNLALKSLPTGGLYIAGGIAPKIMPLLTDGAFMNSFLAKGRMGAVLERIRVSIVTEPHVGMLGARALAARLADEVA